MSLNNVDEKSTKLKIDEIEPDLRNESMTAELDDSLVEFNQAKGHEPRELTDEEKQKLANDKFFVSEFKHNRYEIDAKKNWDLFYRRNKTNFFKDRYWTFREFEELNECNDENSNYYNKYNKLLEIGCGVGNFLFPLIKHNKKIFVYACDFSTDAVQLLKSNPEYDTNRCYGFVCDLTKKDLLRESLTDNVLVDVVTLIFVMSAIHPTKMRDCIRNIAKVLRPGGLVMFRDYGINDHSMIRFNPGHKLDEKFYVRQDGTRTYYFNLEELRELFLSPYSLDNNIENGEKSSLFDEQINEYVFRETVNMKENLRVPRVFIQSKFIRNNVKI